jgi:hypothetical protein
LNPDSRMVRFMSAYKRMEDGVKNLIDVMIPVRVPHPALSNVID